MDKQKAQCGASYQILTITVTKGSGTGVDVIAKANEGADNALDYIESPAIRQGATRASK